MCRLKEGWPGILVMGLIVVCCGKGLRGPGGEIIEGGFTITPAAGGRGARVVLAGADFGGGPVVRLGGVLCANAGLSGGTVSCDVGGNSPGPVDVVVETGSDTYRLTAGFTQKAYLYVVTNADDRLSGFEVAADGSTTPLSSGGSFNVMIGPTTVVLHPNGKFLWVRSGNQVYPFAIDPLTGSLTALSSQLVDEDGTAMAISLDGAFLYLAHTQGPGPGWDVRIYNIAADGSISPLSNNSSLGAGNWDPTLLLPVNPPAGLYLNDTTTGFRSFLRQAGGALSEVPSSPHSLGSVPVSMALSPASDLLFTGENTTQRIGSWARSTTSGDFISQTTFDLTGTTNFTIFAHPSRNFLYMLNQVTNTGRTLTWSDSTGSLSDVPGTFITGPTPVRGVLDAAGKYAYVAHGSGVGGFRIWYYSVGGDGQLTKLGEFPVSEAQFDLVVD